MDNSLLAVRDINHKYIVVEGSTEDEDMGRKSRDSITGGL